MSYKTRSGGYNRFLMMTRISAWSPGELVEIESYSARLAMSGAGAMQLCHKQPFDAVPLDLKLGAASGLDVLRDLRSQ
jgi:CheY-like chemotaxis protein